MHFMIQDPASGEITYTRNGHFTGENVKMDFILQQKMESWALDQNRQPL